MFDNQERFTKGWYFTIGVSFQHNSQTPDRVMPFLMGPYATEEEAMDQYHSYSSAGPGKIPEFIQVSPPSYHWADPQLTMMSMEKFRLLRSAAQAVVISLDEMRKRFERLVA